MAIVTLNKKELKNLVGNLSDEKIDETLSLFGTAVERISAESVEVEVTPNRPDMLSQSGIFRALSSYLGKKKKEYKIHKPEKNYSVKIDKNLKEIRPYTACAIVKNLKFNDERIKEIIDIQEKLHSTLGRNRKKVAIGIYPLEKISLPIKYEARKPEDIKFQPLDSDREMTGREILQKHPTGRDYAHLLEGKEKFPVFIDTEGEILSMPPVINSDKTGKITQATRDVFIECSGFDFNMLKKTLNILVTVMSDMQGEIYQMTLDYGKKEITPDLTPEKMKIDINSINKLLGLDLKEAEIKKLLEKIGYTYNSSKKEVEIPAYRTDIMHEVDIAEDVAIAYGYDKLVPEIPQIASIGEEDEKEKIKNKIAEILVGLGLLEISSLHLLTKEDMDKGKVKEAVEVEETKSDYKFLRHNLLVSALKILGENVDAEYPQKIFEIGKCFNKDEKEEAGIKEKDKLVIALTPGNFTELRQVLEYLARMLEIEFKIEETDKEGFIEGRTGKILLDGKNIGVIGEIHPSTLKSWHLKMPLTCLELDLEEILSLG
ncbi:MAG: phenylalanine--tRNA ligase subunit beta [Nanoarchaeota archaeon]